MKLIYQILMTFQILIDKRVPEFIRFKNSLLKCFQLLRQKAEALARQQQEEAIRLKQEELQRIAYQKEQQLKQQREAHERLRLEQQRILEEQKRQVKKVFLRATDEQNLTSILVVTSLNLSFSSLILMYFVPLSSTTHVDRDQVKMVDFWCYFNILNND